MKKIIVLIILSLFLISCSYLKTTSIRLEGQYGKFGGAIELNPQKSKNNFRPTFDLKDGEEAYLISEKELYTFLKAEKEKIKNLDKLNKVELKKKLNKLEKDNIFKIQAKYPYLKPIHFFNMIIKLSK